MNSIIRVSNLYKSYKQEEKIFEVLNGVDLEIKSGEFIGIMGESGSGKSTLMNILSTIDSDYKGEISIDGQVLINMTNEELKIFRKKYIGVIFQEYNLLDTLTNRENILVFPMLLGIDKEESDRRIKDLSIKLGIEEILDKYPVECSGGQKQRVSIARALSIKPKIIFADEPTDSLDMKKAIEVAEILKKINEEYGLTIVLITHEQLIGSYAERILLMKNGKLNKEIRREYGRGEQQDEFHKRIITETSKELEEFLGIY